MAASQPDIQILTQVLDTFSGVFGAGKGALFPWSMRILAFLTVIELVWFGLDKALGGVDSEQFLRKFIRLTIKVGFWIFLVTGIANTGLADTILKGFIATGVKASGTSLGFSMKDPSGIIVAGFQAAEPIMESISNMGNLAVGDKIVAFLCYVGVLAGYFIMAFQVLITFIEWGIVSTLGVILLPFAISKHTSFLAEKAIGAIIAFGIKLMVLAFVIGVIQPIILAIPTLGPDPTWEQMIGLLITTLIIGLIVSQAPGVAASVLSGAPALTSSVATAGAVGAAAAGVGTVMAGGATATGVGAAAAGAGTAVMKAAGAMSGFSSAANSDPGQAAGATATGLAAGAVANSIKTAAGGGAFNEAKGAAAANGMSQITSSLQTGPPPGAPASPGGGVSSSLQSGPPPGGTSGGASLRQGMQDVSMIKQGAPADASPSSGSDFRIQQGGDE